MVKDPVCGMSVDEKKATAKMSHKGKLYHFCGEACQVKFKAEPTKYSNKAKQ
jgi:Cu+-exporting ATPase